ncbi:Stealth CR1 domain-containing protein [Alistipes sp. OttesenSCG-928-B03]|nr:Stealth CR1 domain-containing protein [Alistipes sp. OttesenSCG-928-B03]
MSTIEQDEPIDVVIAWVDGDDPAHREKMRPYLTKEAAAEELIASPTRFRQVNEVFFCVASVLKFAPFVRNIFIITDEQDPQLDCFVDKYFPDRTTAIRIVDHKELFRGYEHHLPTFNARCIECSLFRVPGLAENFVYMNDDFVLLRPLSPQDWFDGGKVVGRGKWRNMKLDSINDRLRGRYRPFSCKNSMRNAASLLNNSQRFFHITHTPHPQKRSLIERFHAGHPDLLESSLAHRFRDKTQYNAQSLGYMLAAEEGLLELAHDCELYMKPVGRGDKYVDKKIACAVRGQQSACLQALDMATVQDRAKIFDWLCGILEVDIDDIKPCRNEQ